MKDLDFVSPQITNPKPIKIYNIDTKAPVKDVLKGLTLSLYYIHFRNQKYVRDSTIEIKIQKTLDNFNTSFKNPIKIDDLKELAEGPVYRSGKEPFDFIAVGCSQLESKRIKNKREDLLKDNDDLRQAISYAVFSAVNSKNSDDCFKLLSKYSKIFYDPLINTMNTTGLSLNDINNIKENPYLEIVKHLEHIQYSTGLQIKLSLQDFDFNVAKVDVSKFVNSYVLDFFTNISHGYMLFKTHSTKKNSITYVDELEKILNNCNKLMTKINMPTISTGDIDYVVNNKRRFIETVKVKRDLDKKTKPP
jgi:hypothetical protein